MKILLIISTLLTISCSRLEQNDLIVSEDLGQTTKGTIIYKLYQTGIDNYRYEFYLVDSGDSVDIFQSYLNDATYKGLKFIVRETKDTVKIKSTRDLGQVAKKIGDRMFVLQRKIDPFLNLSFTVHGESSKMTCLMLYNDSISVLTDLEISIHKKIWDREEVDSVARDLRTKDIKTFTFIEKYPSNNLDYYLVKFGQVSEEKLPAISYYRVDNKSGLIDKIVELD